MTLGGLMEKARFPSETLSPWWKHGVVLVVALGFTILIWLAVRSYSDAPPIPEKVIGRSGEVLFTGEDISSGQEVFLKYALMENGTIWGHGAYLGPDFSAQYLHAVAEEAQAGGSQDQVRELLKENRYDPQSGTLVFSKPEVRAFGRQIQEWTRYFASPANNAGLPAKYIRDPQAIRQLTAFFAWTAWASVANRPGKPYSYTNNFPYDPAVGNVPTSAAVIWSALSL